MKQPSKQLSIKTKKKKIMARYKSCLAWSQKS